MPIGKWSELEINAVMTLIRANWSKEMIATILRRSEHGIPRIIRENKQTIFPQDIKD